jgi:hypothetical protein
MQPQFRGFVIYLCRAPVGRWPCASCNLFSLSVVVMVDGKLSASLCDLN